MNGSFLFSIIMTCMPERDPSPPLKIDPIYISLRNKLLFLNPQEVEFKPTKDHPTVWGVLMESAYAEAVVTLAALVDGTTSLYFSNGGGILGSGTQALVGTAARRMITVAEQALEFTLPVEDYPLPMQASINFYLLTYRGIHSAICREVDLQSGKHLLSGLYLAGHELIAQVRLVSEKKKPE